MRDITSSEIDQVSGGNAVLAALAIYVGALMIVQQMGESSGAANARRTAEQSES